MSKSRQSDPWCRAYVSFISCVRAGARTNRDEQSRAAANEARVLLAIAELIELESKLMLAVRNLELIVQRRSDQRS